MRSFSDCDDCDWLLRSADCQDDWYQQYKDASFGYARSRIVRHTGQQRQHRTPEVAIPK